MTAVSVWNVASVAGKKAITVTLVESNVIKTQDGSIAYANLRYNSDGNEYENTLPSLDNFGSNRGQWLDTGDAADCWLEYTITNTQGSGLSSAPAASPTRHQMNSNIDFKANENDPGSGSNGVTMDVEVYDASSGGTLLDSATIIIRARRWDTGP